MQPAPEARVKTSAGPSLSSSVEVGLSTALRTRSIEAPSTARRGHHLADDTSDRAAACLARFLELAAQTVGVSTTRQPREVHRVYVEYR